MSHHIYHTQGFVLATANIGEANRYITLFTRELGVVSAIAQGIRKGSSKLRYALQEYSFAHADLVRGAHAWRVTSGSVMPDFDALRADPTKLALYAKLLSMVRRLCPGEEPNDILFDECYRSFSFLQSAVLTPEIEAGFELVALARMLKELGHLGAFPNADAYLLGEITQDMCIRAANAKQLLIKEINAAVRESQL